MVREDARLPLLGLHRSTDTDRRRQGDARLPGAVGRPRISLRPDHQRRTRPAAKLPDYYLFHEHLEPDNRPLYFHEFAERVPPPSCSISATPIADDGTYQLSRRCAAGPPQALEQRRPSGAVHGLPAQPDVPAELAGEAERPALTFTHAGELAGPSRRQFRAGRRVPDGPESVFRGRTNETLTTKDQVLITALRTPAKIWPGSSASRIS